MGFYFNGLTSAKKMLYKQGKYSKAYVGNNLVHTGTALTRYITWKVDGNYIVIKTDGYVNTTLKVEFDVYYGFDYVSESGNKITYRGFDVKYISLRYGYDYQNTIDLHPLDIPSAPTGYTFSSYTVLSVSPYRIYPTSDELYTYSFKAL